MTLQHDANVLIPFSLVSDADTRLHTSPYLPLRRITCVYEEGVLVLRGRVPTYFHKQVAQATVADVPGIERIVNQIQIVPSSLPVPPDHLDEDDYAGVD